MKLYREFADWFHLLTAPADYADEAADYLKMATEARGSAPRTMLELGCGHGYNLESARQEGWKVWGVEMTGSFLNGNGIDVEIAPLETARSLTERRYDVVLLAAVLEHVYDPVECLRKVHAALEDDGLVFIDVPNECSLGMRVGNAYMRSRGRDWAINLSPTFPPFHVVGFCPTSLRRCLGDTGFEIEELVQHRWANMLERNGLQSRVEHSMFSLVSRLGKWVGMADGLSCWARKQSPG